MEKEVTKIKCPYTNFRNKVMKWIGILRTPTKEYGGMAPCPFVGPEIDKNKLMIELFDPEKTTIIDMMNKFVETQCFIVNFILFCLS